MVLGKRPDAIDQLNRMPGTAPYSGAIYKIQLDGRIVGKFGRAGKVPGEFGMVNSLDCRTDTTIWVGEVWNWRVQKVTLRG